ncbi:MAG: hypothetical protein Q7J68_05455, partial [Thermoplasmata archaeon]|nr:hypothetical protein [Thermoplasmata archaeon]
SLSRYYLLEAYPAEKIAKENTAAQKILKEKYSGIQPGSRATALANFHLSLPPLATPPILSPTPQHPLNGRSYYHV